MLQHLGGETRADTLVGPRELLAVNGCFLLNCALNHLSHLKKALKQLLKLSLIRDFKTWGQSSLTVNVKRFPLRGVACVANKHIASVYMVKLSGG